MTKLIIQIPCYNEEQTLPTTLSQLPRHVPGVDEVEWLVVDDGSEDRTAEVARSNGADHVVRLTRNRGLARAFMAGLDAALDAGADIIVNTDADNQYSAEDIPKLVEPILEGKAEIVVGARAIGEIQHFSRWKKLLQRLGSWVTRLVSNTDIPDAVSGFRAISREAAMKMHVFNEYTYTIETIIQAGQKGMAITSVPVRTNDQLRPSRLIVSLPAYIRQQVLTMLRIFMTYRSFRFFAALGGVLFLAGLGISLRFMYFFLTERGSGHIQSLILSALLMGSGFLMAVVGILADLISVNRKLLEGLDWRLKKMEESVTGGVRRGRTKESRTADEPETTGSTREIG